MTAFAERYGPRALICGASEGIGAAFARALAARGLDLTLVARRQGPLEDLAAALVRDHGVACSTALIDLATPPAGAALADLWRAHDHGLLVCNAGAAHGAGLFDRNPLARELALVHLNCLTPTAIVHHALQTMVPRRRGGIVLVSSMSGLAGSGHVATYAAAKSFGITLAEGLHWENAGRGVDVLCAIASLTDTPAMHRSGMDMAALPGFVPMASEAVAEGALAHLGRQAVWSAAGEAAIEAARTSPRAEWVDRGSRMAAALWGMDQDPPKA